jgi:hypothetical protein
VSVPDLISRRNVFLTHEQPPNAFNPVIYGDPTYIENGFNFKIGRCLIPFEPKEPVADNIIGSFGFGFGDKNFETIVERVNEEFDTALIRLHLPNSTFADPTGAVAKEIIQNCISMGKPGIEFEISDSFLNVQDLLTWLSKNSINVFAYGNRPARGISSVTDYALSAKRPIAISKCHMFRHLHKQEIMLESNDLKTIIKNGTKPLEEYYARWTRDNLIKDFERIIGAILEKIRSGDEIHGIDKIHGDGLTIMPTDEVDDEGL